MSKAPSMPMYWDAYLADTTHLTTEEHGAYLLLLGAMWRRDGSVPDSDADNARILGLSKPRWTKIKSRLSEFLTFDGERITQKKLQETWKNTQEKIAVNRANGAKGGRAKASNNKDLDLANATNSLKQKATIPEPEPEPLKKDTNVSAKKPPIKKAVFDILSNVAGPDAVNGFIEMRWSIKAPMTERSAKLIADKLAGKLNADAILDLSTENNWKTVYPDSNQLNGANNGKQSYNEQASARDGARIAGENHDAVRIAVARVKGRA